MKNDLKIILLIVLVVSFSYGEYQLFLIFPIICGLTLIIVAFLILWTYCLTKLK